MSMIPRVTINPRYQQRGDRPECLRCNIPMVPLDRSQSEWICPSCSSKRESDGSFDGSFGDD